MAASDNNSAAVVAVILWSAPAAFGLSLWFIIRFVKHHDDFKIATQEEFNKLKKSISETVESIQKSGRTVEQCAVDVERSNLAFQKQVGGDLLRLERKYLEIDVHLEATAKKATEVETGVGKVAKALDAVAETANGHSKSISLAAQAIKTHETEIKKIGEDVYRIQNRKPGS